MRPDEVYEEDDPTWSPQERERQGERRRDEEEVKRKTDAGGKQQQEGNGLDINDLLAGSGGKEGMEAAFGKIQQNLEGIGYKGPGGEEDEAG